MEGETQPKKVGKKSRREIREEATNNERLLGTQTTIENLLGVGSRIYNIKSQGSQLLLQGDSSKH